MKKTIAVTAVAVLSFALLAGCGSKADPPEKSPDTTSPTTTAPVTPQDDRESVAKAATDLFATLSAESLAFEKSQKLSTSTTFDKAFSKTIAVIDLTSFKTQKHAYAAIYIEGDFANFMASKSPKTSVSDPFTIKDVRDIKVTGDKATFKQTIIPAYKDVGDEYVTFNKVNDKWLLDGAKYTDAFFELMTFDINDSIFK